MTAIIGPGTRVVFLGWPGHDHCCNPMVGPIGSVWTCEVVLKWHHTCTACDRVMERITLYGRRSYCGCICGFKPLEGTDAAVETLKAHLTVKVPLENISP